MPSGSEGGRQRAEVRNFAVGGWRPEAKTGNNSLKLQAKRSSNLMPPKAIGQRA